MEYLVEPELLRRLEFRGMTSLKGIERPRLRELILQDLQIYKQAALSEIHRRIGPEIPPWKLRRAIRELCAEGTVAPKGQRKARWYLLNKTEGNRQEVVNKTAQ